MTFDVKHPVPLPSHLSLSLLLDLTQTLCISLSLKLNPNFALTLKTSRILLVWVFTEDCLICCISGVGALWRANRIRKNGHRSWRNGSTYAPADQVKLNQLYMIPEIKFKFPCYRNAESKVDETLYPLIKAWFSTLLCSVLSITLGIW